MAGYTDRCAAFFSKAGVIDDESAAGASGKQSIGPERDLVHERAVFPGRVADGVVNGLVVEIRHMLFHALDVLGTALGLHEAEEIGLDLVGVAITASPEETGEILDERHKAAGGSDDVL